MPRAHRAGWERRAPPLPRRFERDPELAASGCGAHGSVCSGRRRASIRRRLRRNAAVDRKAHRPMSPYRHVEGYSRQRAMQNVKLRQAAERISTVSGSSPSPVGTTVGALGVGAPSAGSGSADSRSTVGPTYSRTRHRVPRARRSAPSGSSPRVDRCSTSPSGNRRVRIGVVGIHEAYIGADGGGCCRSFEPAPRTRSERGFRRSVSRAKARPGVAPSRRSPESPDE